MLPSSDCPFTDVPSNPILDTTDNVSTLTWKYNHEGYEWRTRVETENYTLYDSQYLPQRALPWKAKDLYNVTKLIDDQNVTSVSITISVSDDVRKHIPYVFCNISRLSYNSNTDTNDHIIFLSACVSLHRYGVGKSCKCSPPSTGCPFIDVPPASVSVTINNVLELIWTFQVKKYNNWRLRIGTEFSTFYQYPHPSVTPPNIPIKENYDYSVNITTDANPTDKITVTMAIFSLQISDNVLKHIPNIFCRIIYHPDEKVVKYTSPSVFLELKGTVSLTTVPSLHQETSSSQETPVKTYTAFYYNNTLSTVYTTTNAGSNLHLQSSLVVPLVIWIALHVQQI